LQLEPTKGKIRLMKYAVVRIGGKQYKAEALLMVDGEKVETGKPVLKDAKVKIKVVADLEKGEKIEIYKFKAKSRYKRHTGFRPQYSRLLVEKIG
jgi:large subunit ribosomal protein L21